jgi:hypothetical protein
MNNNLTHTKGLRSNPYNRNTSSSSSSSSTSTRSYFNSSGISESDTDFSDSEDRQFPILRRDTPQRAKIMTVKCKDKNIKGNELIKITHELIQKKYSKIIDDLNIYGFTTCGWAIPLNYPTLFILPHLPVNYHRVGINYSYTLEFPDEINSQHGKVVMEVHSLIHWLISLGGWKGMQPETEIKQYGIQEYAFSGQGRRKFAGVKIYDTEIIFPIKEHRIHLPVNFAIGKYLVTDHWEKDEEGKEWSRITKTDLTYGQINKAINEIKERYEISDSRLAEMQLKCLVGSYDTCLNIDGQGKRTIFHDLSRVPINIQEQIRDFLNYLNALMFGIEPSGLNASLATSLMTLDLIKGGKLTYQTAFVADRDNGGAYPYATCGNNSGTYNARVPIINGENTSMKEYRANPAKSPVANKEATIIKQWLRFKQVIEKDRRYEKQLGKISKAITGLLLEYLTY